MQPTTNDTIAGLFVRFAERECHGRSPLYEKLSHVIAADPEMLGIASHGRAPIPNLFLGAVHYLLRRDPTAALRRFYPSLNASADSSIDPSGSFRSFCLAHADAIIQLLKARHVQTNEVARCGYLLPAFSHVWRMGGRKPLFLIEVGTSAGLHLCFDRYAYDFGDSRVYGNANSLLRLKIEFRGPVRPALTDLPTPVVRRIGIDLNPIRADDLDAVEWLEALVWPEHQERLQNLRMALNIARHVPIEFVTGDASRLMDDTLRSAGLNGTVCIFESATINQFTTEARERFFKAIEQAAREGEVFFLSRQDQLTLRRYRGSECHVETLAETDAHGRWVEWKMSQNA